ncbi:dipeptidyl aminopeptidase/acylaminoacyl peptidase [Saccharothrix ecbatanensis]|uniref:Dipeptidyl aminopeptidase/acylaminoacyl peptidase n=1 Tax=Saccharothrix ecbatanensis TaxID=1105145 RepID=A0A7W9HL38_9PSEU|nr:S9 family peptidase [Saccharothrix ecbatanensis]MBB5803739.1 dipeptidyl aminopeptidase/acylaminoacyl peptidase [Saccharothrix ecbatanensis]
MADYREFAPSRRFRSNVALSPDGGFVAYAANPDGPHNLYVTPVSGGQARRITDYTEHSVRQVAWSPDGRSLLYTADFHGDEQFQLYLVDAAGGVPRRLTDAACQHVLGSTIYEFRDISPFTPDGRSVVYAGNDRDAAVQDVLVQDLETGVVRRVESVPATRLHAVSVSPDGRWLLTSGMHSIADTDLGLVDLHDPDAPLRVVTAHEDKRLHVAGPWTDSGFLLLHNTGREFLALGSYSPATGVVTESTPPWDVEQVVASGAVRAWTVNEDGLSRLFVTRDGEPVALPELPSGVIASLAAAGDVLTFLFTTGSRPTEVVALDLATNELRHLTSSAPSVACVEPQLVRYPTHDGREVPAWLYRPDGDGVRGVVLSIHGGPEAQERPQYNYTGLYQYLVSQGIAVLAVLAPNVRGSTGYGKTYQRLILHDYGGDELGDFEHAVKYLHGLGWVDPARIGVWGGSYGGFAALSCLSRLPSLWAAGVSVVGPSNLLTMVRSVPETWRASKAESVGDPDTEADFLLARSPITYADAITAPLFVVQGANDPRVVKAESDQIVAALRGRGVDVRYDVYEDEGHGFANRANELQVMSDVAGFLVAHLGG